MDKAILPILEFIESTLNSNLLDNEKSFDLIEEVSKYIATVKLPLLEITSSENFVNFLLAWSNSEKEGLRKDELDHLTKQNEDLIDKIFNKPKDSPEYEKLIEEQKVIAHKMAEIIVPYAQSTIALSKYKAKDILDATSKLNENISNAKEKGNVLRTKIRNSRIWIKIQMIIIAVILAIATDYVTVFLEVLIELKILHIAIVVLVTLPVLIWVEPILKRIESKKLKSSILEHLKKLKEDYINCEKELNIAAQSVGINSDQLLDLASDFFNKQKKNK